MSLGRSVQFRGIDNVLRAYESNAVAPYALFQGTQLLSKSEDQSLENNKALLSELLNRLNNEDNVATYTLCVYDDLKDGEKIKNNTKYDGSFNFKLNDSMQDYKSQRSAGMGAIMERLEAIEANQNRKNEIEETEPEEKSGWAAIGKLIEHPDVQRAIAGKFVAILDGITNLFPGANKVFPSPSFPAQIGAVTKTLSGEQTEKLNHAIEFLSTVDPLLGDHLYSIAVVARQDPAKYNSIISMINLL